MQIIPELRRIFCFSMLTKDMSGDFLFINVDENLGENMLIVIFFSRGVPFCNENWLS